MCAVEPVSKSVGIDRKYLSLGVVGGFLLFFVAGVGVKLAG